VANNPLVSLSLSLPLAALGGGLGSRREHGGSRGATAAGAGSMTVAAWCDCDGGAGERQWHEHGGSMKQDRQHHASREPGGSAAWCEHGVWERQPPVFY